VTRALHHAAPYLTQQDYETYTVDQHAIWAELIERRWPQVEKFGCEEYLAGYAAIGLDSHKLPELATITGRLIPLTGWSTTPVSGFLPGPAFFEMLAARHFPSTIWLRQRGSLEYTPEPDIFHDVFGHVPMHAQPIFADFLQHYGEICARTDDASVLERLGRVFWYTVEFGLIRQKGKLKIFGSGVISSHGESLNVIEGRCQVRRFELNEVLNTPVKVDEVHQVLFVIDSFDQMYDALLEAEKRLTSSRGNTGRSISVGFEWRLSKKWKVEKRRAARRFTFANPAAATKFVKEIGEAAEKHRHHPELEIVKEIVTISLSYSQSLSGRDVELAQFIDKIASAYWGL
jgi:phenylalanine-4-hydroxylase